MQDASFIFFSKTGDISFIKENIYPWNCLFSQEKNWPSELKNTKALKLTVASQENYEMVSLQWHKKCDALVLSKSLDEV
jgi:hypothetical protein